MEFRPIGAVGDALREHVLEGRTFSSEAAGAEVEGTMPDNGAVEITPGTSEKQIPEGYHDGNGVVKGDSNLTSDNIRDGVSIFGVTGSVAARGEVLGVKATSRASGYTDSYTTIDWAVPSGTNYVIGTIGGSGRWNNFSWEITFPDGQSWSNGDTTDEVIKQGEVSSLDRNFLLKASAVYDGDEWHDSVGITVTAVALKL